MHFLPGRGTQVKMIEKRKITLNNIFHENEVVWCRNIWIHSFFSTKRCSVHHPTRRSNPIPSHPLINNTRENSLGLYWSLLNLMILWNHCMQSICLLLLSLIDGVVFFNFDDRLSKGFPNWLVSAVCFHI